MAQPPTLGKVNFYISDLISRAAEIEKQITALQSQLDNSVSKTGEDLTEVTTSFVSITSLLTDAQENAVAQPPVLEKVNFILSGLKTRLSKMEEGITAHKTHIDDVLSKSKGQLTELSTSLVSVSSLLNEAKEVVSTLESEKVAAPAAEVQVEPTPPAPAPAAVPAPAVVPATEPAAAPVREEPPPIPVAPPPQPAPSPPPAVPTPKPESQDPFAQPRAQKTEVSSPKKESPFSTARSPTMKVRHGIIPPST
ncbi:MAG: hypothetical protein ACW976_07730, partial [Candidatus Ranarchaeia archaeon]